MTQKINMDSLKNIPVLDDSRLYIYVMVNTENYIKIGQTKNIYQRYQSLSGSNSAGHPITKVYCSPATVLYTLEGIMHTIFNKYRIQGTEWFYGSDLEFEDVVKRLKELFYSDEYKRCNAIRKKYNEEIRERNLKISKSKEADNSVEINVKSTKDKSKSKRK